MLKKLILGVFSLAFAVNVSAKDATIVKKEEVAQIEQGLKEALVYAEQRKADGASNETIVNELEDAVKVAAETGSTHLALRSGSDKAVYFTLGVLGAAAIVLGWYGVKWLRNKWKGDDAKAKDLSDLIFKSNKDLVDIYGKPSMLIPPVVVPTT